MSAQDDARMDREFAAIERAQALENDDNHVEIYKDAEGKYRWHRYAGNRLKVSESGQGFTRVEYAVKSAGRYNKDLSRASFIWDDSAYK